MLIYDIFERVAEYLTVEEIVRVSYLDRAYYQMYRCNRADYDKLIMKKMCQFLDINLHVNKKTLCNMYGYFRNHWRSSRADYLVYMIDNRVDDDDLFDLVLQMCELRSCVISSDERFVGRAGGNVGDHRKTDNMGVLSFNDIKYILVYSDITKLNMVLSRFVLSIKLLSSVINEILISDVVLYKRSRSCNRLKNIIRYIFIKHGFGSFTTIDTTYIHSIIVMLIKYARTDVLEYFFYKRKMYRFVGRLDYQYLVHQCIEYRDTTHLQILLNHIAIEKEQTNSTIYVFIDSTQIDETCRNADFEYLEFIVERLLADTVNMKLYVDKICSGIEYLIYSNRMDELHGFGVIKDYLTQETLDKINRYIRIVYDKMNILNEKRVYV